MTTATAQVQQVYNKQGYLSALPVLNATELGEARQAFADLEKEFGEDLRTKQGPEEAGK